MVGEHRDAKRRARKVLAIGAMANDNRVRIGFGLVGNETAVASTAQAEPFTLRSIRKFFRLFDPETPVVFSLRL